MSIEKFCEEELRKLFEHTGVTEKGCIIWLPGKQTYGKTRIVLPNSKSRVEYVHRLSYMLHNRQFSLPSTLEVSHLCHCPRCLRVDHFVLEPHAINADRQHCAKQNKCTHCHFPYCLIDIEVRLTAISILVQLLKKLFHLCMHFITNIFMLFSDTDLVQCMSKNCHSPG